MDWKFNETRSISEFRYADKMLHDFGVECNIEQYIGLFGNSAFNSIIINTREVNLNKLDINNFDLNSIEISKMKLHISFDDVDKITMYLSLKYLQQL